jgi:uncharacterized membrane protein
MSKIIRYFLQGLILIAPVAITVYALVMLFEFIDGLLIKTLTNLIGFEIPGLGLVIIVVTISLIGYLGTTILFKPIISSLDKLISQAPLVKIIYTSIKDFMSAFVGKDKKFTEPVLVKVNKDSELEKFGFITQHDLSKMGVEKGKVAVYLPHSYNFSGNLFVVPIENVRPIDASPTEVMKFIVTAGVTSIPEPLEISGKGPSRGSDPENQKNI